MLQIGELSEQTGVSAKTIRFYEEVGLLPPAMRAENGYRTYGEEDVERLQFVRRMRALDFTLDDIAEILAFQERNEPPCRYVMALMREQIDQISTRISDLERMRDDLATLLEAGRHLPEDALMRSCVCHLIQTADIDIQSGGLGDRLPLK